LKIENKSGGDIMTKLAKLFLPALLAASALAAPAIALAQGNNAPVTRAEVRAQLTQLEKAGYSPATNDNYYPQGLQEAQQRVDASNGTATRAYGPSTSGTSASGLHVPVAPASGDAQHSIYFGH
jgi:ABC-type sugar transport system substrate-binding protein